MTTHHTSGAADLPEALRVPLDSLHADAGYLCGRLLNGSLTQEQVVESIRRRIDAAKLAALTAQAISVEPAGACTAELRRLHAELETLPVGYINRGIAPHTKGKTVFHEKPTINLEARWWSRDEPVFLASQGQAPALDRDRIREIFMAHGFTVKEGQTDLKQYVYDAAEALLRASRAPAESVTAPADTTPHPVRKPDTLVNGEALKLALNALRRAGNNEVADELLLTAQVIPASQSDSVLEDAERWEFRWLNPANQQNVAPSELAWKTVNSKGMRSEKEVLEDLKTYRYQGKPVYELRPLFATRALQKPEIRCPVRLANGGDCPRHNLQCGWPDCNKETK